MKGLPTINQKGMIVGNGATDFNVDVSASFPETLYNFQIMKKPLYQYYKENNCFNSFRAVIPENHSPECVDAWRNITSLSAGLNWYDLYRKNYPLGLRANDPERYAEVEINGEIKKYRRGKTVEEYTPWAKHVKGDHVLGATMTDYIN